MRNATKASTVDQSDAQNEPEERDGLLQYGEDHRRDSRRALPPAIFIISPVAVRWRLRRNVTSLRSTGGFWISPLRLVYGRITGLYKGNNDNCEKLALRFCSNRLADLAMEPAGSLGGLRRAGSEGHRYRQ